MRRRQFPGKRVFSEDRLLQVLYGPQISEKATLLGDQLNQVVFRVAPDATKPEIKAAIELVFKVDVVSVSVANQKGKPKRFGRGMGKRRDVKKAYIGLKAGQDIAFAEGGSA
jgi:large subunit ribosomal protein L23